MTSAEKIIAGILDEARTQAEEIVSAAKAEAEKEIETAKQRADELQRVIISDAEAQAEIIRQTGKSGAELKLRNAALMCKRREIDRVLNTAKERINAMPDREYFEFLAGIAKSSGAEGELMLSASDASRDVSLLIKALSGLSVTVSKEFADIGGGFILKNGDIEINADIDALINERRDELTDSINSILFKG